MIKVNLSEKELSLVKKILENRRDIYLFGSRVSRDNRRYSDLDICLKESISSYKCELLRESFEESDLLFTVDIVEYGSVSNSFKSIIDSIAVALDQVIAT